MLTSRSKGIASWKFVLLAIDSVFVASALIVAAIFYCSWMRHEDPLQFIINRQWVFYFAWVAYIASFYLSGLYEAERVVRLRSTFLFTAIGASVGTVASVTIFFLFFRPLLGPKILVPVSILQFLYMPK